MNVAICYESVLPARGGCETYVADLLRRLDRDRHEIHLYGCRLDRDALPRNLQFHSIPAPGGPRSLRPWRFAAAASKALEKARHDVVVGLVKTWNQDVLIPQGGLHVASTQGNLRKYRQPWLRGLIQATKWLSATHWSYWLLERKQYLGSRPPVLVVPSQVVLQDVRAAFGAFSQPLHVIPNAIDQGRFSSHDRLRERAALRSALNVAPETNVGLFVGHNYRLKGLEPLLEAVATLPAMDFQLLVCGSANFRRHERLARRLGVLSRVTFLGFVQDVRNCFFAADYLVHPTFYDPCSLVVLEALACGLPVLTTRYNGAAELLHPPQDGLVIDDPWDVAALASALTHLSDPRQRRSMSRMARVAAEAWTFEDHYQRLLAVFEQVRAAKHVA